MRKQFLVLVGFILLGASCPPADNTPVGSEATDNAGEEVLAASPEGAQCHAGTFECADGEEVTACGTWYFDADADGGVSGAGEITAAALGSAVPVTVSGVIDQGVGTYQLVLTSTAGGSGTMTLTYNGPTEELIGSWSFTSRAEPDGIEVSGGLAGTSCTVLP